MSSTQYIKIFNDTVLKQSILQGYEIQRTNSELGKFTMGELAFTRDTGRVFVGTYTDNKKSSDIAYKQGGLLVGNKYYGASNDGKTLTHYPSYNSNYGVYNGDYTFDNSTCSFILFDNTITKSDNVTDDICDDGFIRMRILEPDGDTIKYDSDKTTRNVLKADFNFGRVSQYFGEDWTCEADTIKIKNINLSNDAICNLPSTVYFNSLTGITFKGEELIQTKFPSYLLCGERSETEDEDGNTIERFNVSFKNFLEVINITAGKGIKIEKDSPTDDYKPQIKISLDETSENPNPDDNPDDDPPSSTTPEATQTPWDIADGYFYSGVSRFSRSGTLVATETYGNTKIHVNTDKDENGEIIPPTDGSNVVFDYVVTQDDEEKAAKEKATLDFIENKYIGGLFNIGLNYLKSPLSSFYIFTESDDEDDDPTTVKNFSNLSNEEICVENMFTKHSYNNKDYYPRIIPSHAQSIIFQITGKGSKATFANNGLTILKQTIVSEDITTVEVPLYAKMRWENDTDENNKVTSEAVSYKYFNITSSNCTVKLLGYRV